MVQYQGNFTQLTDLDPVLTDIFYQHYDVALGGGDVGTEANRISAAGVLQLFNQQQSTKAKETDLRIDSFRDPKEFTGKVEYQTVNRGYEVEYSHTEFASGFQVTRAMADDLQYDGIFSSAQEMGTAFARKIRKDAASVFNNAFTAGTTAGYDGVALCSSSHPRSRTDSTTVTNTYTLALTSDNLESIITSMQDVGDDQDNEITVLPDTIIVPRALRRTALEIAGSELVPENANNAMNVYSGSMNVIVDPYLTDTNAWFVVDATMSARYLKWYNRVLAEFAAMADFDTLIRKYRGYMRYTYGWSDWRWVAGSNPS